MAMKFRCERDTLLDALTVAVRAVAGTGSTRVALTGVRFELQGDMLTVTGSDLDLTLSVTSSVAGEGDGIAVTPARLLTDVVRALPAGAVQFDVSDDEASIVAGSSQFSIRLIPADDYPQLLFQGEESAANDSTSFSPAVAFKGQEFRDALGQVVKSVSSDSSRPILTGVLMEAQGEGRLRLVSTDSYRLSVRDLAGSSLLGEDQKVLVPGRALSELQRLIADSDEVTLKLAEQYAQFAVRDTRLTSRLILGDFPNYRGLIPADHPNRLTADRERLLEVVRRVRLLAQDSTPVRLSMGAGDLEVQAITQDVGQANDSLEADYEGEDLIAAFNPTYLIDGLEATDGEAIILETADAVKPALLRSANDDGFLYLLMPVRVS